MSDVKKSLREILKEPFRLIIDYSREVFMERVNYIN